jgi:hypothetical protein
MEQYPEVGYIKAEKIKDNYTDFLKVYNEDYNVVFYFLPYNLKYTEDVSSDVEVQNIANSISSIVANKGLKRTINISFQARQKLDDGVSLMPLNGDELLHTLDHFKRSIYPTFSNNNEGQLIADRLPVFWVQYKNLICDGEDTMGYGKFGGVRGTITTFKIDPVMDAPNSLYYNSNTTFVYPKAFDVSFSLLITEPNTNLLKTSSRLAKRHFFNYVHEHRHSDTATIGSSENTNANNNGGGNSKVDKAKNKDTGWTPI